MVIKKGGSRTVILISNYAIKIPTFYSWNRFVEGLLNNGLEKEIWSVYNKSTTWFCPVVFSICSLVIVMKRATPLEYEFAWDKCPDDILQCFEDVHRWDSFYKDICIEIKPSNIGLIDNKPVLLDYGYNRWLFSEK